ncbi:P-loop containing nucleoside triphosphate hydrolase protein, partial [Baffinella frigidus]
AEVGGVAVQLKGARVEWEEGKAALQGVDLTALVGDLVAVVGPVGAGKSTLLSALLGEAPCKEGSVSVIEGRLGYVPQQAWVLNASVKDNILMGQPFDEAKYARAVHAASLQQVHL